MNTDKAYCTVTKETYKLKAGTKGAYELVETEQKQLTEEQYKNTVDPDTMRFFRRLGGSESATKCYTCKGYLVYKLVSKSPDRHTKIIRTFSFDQPTGTTRKKRVESIEICSKMIIKEARQTRKLNSLKQ